MDDSSSELIMARNSQYYSGNSFNIDFSDARMIYYADIIRLEI